MRIRPTGGSVYRLKVTLRELKPPVWRRFLVSGNITLKRLHDVLQAVMGWTDTHLHQFETRELFYGPEDPDMDPQCVSESRTRLDQVLRSPKDRMIYEYDFGDGWEHEILLEAILPADPQEHYPLILAGRRARPPEDVGGTPGYEEFLQALADPAHPEHEEMLAWAGGAFDPEAFDIREANLAIHGERPRR